MQAPYVTYTLEQGLVDVQRYDQETCNLNIGLNELRASLITGPGGPRSTNPILPLPPGPPSSLLPPPPPIILPAPPIAPPPPAAPHKPPPGRLTPNPAVALNSAIDRIKGEIKDEKAAADQIEKCGLPKDPVAATTLTDTAKTNIARCLNSVRIRPGNQPSKAQNSLDDAITKMAPLSIEDQRKAKQKCLEIAGFPPNQLLSELQTGTLSKAQELKVDILAKCLKP